MKLGDNNSYEIRGIGDVAAATTVSAYHNTVYISGAPTTLALNSAALFSLNTANTRNYKNNILVNTRSNNGATGKHYALSMTSGGTVAVDYNDYYVSGTDTYLGNLGGTDKTALPIVSSNDAASVTTNPSFANAGGNTALDYKPTTAIQGVSGTGVTTDYAGTNRSAATMGAYFIPTIVPVASGTVNSNDLTLSGASQIEIAAGAELNLNSVLPTISKIILAPTAKLTMGANTINAANGVILQSDATGTATLTGDVAVSNATVQQYVTSGRNWYMSSPVSAADYTWLSRGTSVQGWNEATKAWVPVTSGTLVRGKGYVQVATTIVSPPSVTGTTGTVNVTGTTNSGDVAITVSRTESGSSRGFNLVGNPYPSYLKWTGTNGFLADTSNDSISTSFWYRTKNTLGDYVFTTYNGSSNEVVGGTTANTLLNELIPPMQAFWIRVNANTEVSTHNVILTFKNNMRFHGVSDNNKFKAPKENERMRLRLQLANGIATDEALIYFDANALNSFDNYDSPKMLNNSTMVPDLYSKAGDEKLVINGLAEVTNNLTMPLGFTLKAAASGLILKVNELSNFAVGTKVYLIDNDLSTQTELLPETQYAFNTTSATSNNESRFSLIFRAPGITTDIENTTKPNAQVFVNSANQITIIAIEKSNYAIYNAVGQKVTEGAITNNLQTVNYKLQAGIYVVKVGNNSKRVIIK